MRAMRFTAWLLAAWVLGLGPASAQPNPSGSLPGDPQAWEDASACRERAASLEVTCTVLYGHFFDLINRVPINVQQPHPDCPDLSRGFSSTPTVEPYFDQAQMTMFSSPGFVEYGVREGACEPLIHPERGLMRDVLLDRNVPLVLYWYLSADGDEVSLLGADPDADLGAMPCVTVRATLQTGEEYGVGVPIAVGEATRAVLSSRNTSQVLPAKDPCAAGEFVERLHPNLEIAQATEFPVSLGVATQDIPRVEAFVVYIEWWQVDETGPGNKLAQREWNVHTGTEFRPRLVVPVLNPVYVDEVRPQSFLGTVYVHGTFASPWGSYDVDPGSVRLELVDHAGASRPIEHLGEPIVVYDVSHRGHFIPVNMTFPWDVAAEGLEAGTYHLRLSVQNWQHTATVAREARIELPAEYWEKPCQARYYSSDGILQRCIGRTGHTPKPDTPEERESPTVGSLAFAAIVALAFAARRIR